jgi:DNA invertase Pin-like site-specific DNA recombinase
MNGYGRFSPRATTTRRGKADGDNPINSIATQKSLIQGWLGAHGMPLLSDDQFLVDEFTSARLIPLNERPAGKQLSDRIAGGDRAVIATALDRLFRNTIDGLTILDEWQGLGVSLYLTNGVVLDLGTASGRLTATMLLGVAQFECQLTAERTSQSHLTRQAQGYRVSARLPYGRAIDPEDHKRTIVCKHESDNIDSIVDMHRGGSGFREIARRLNSSETSCRGNKWHHGTIKAILQRAHGV